MAQFNREDLKARYALFEAFALDDQRHYYQRTIAKHRKAVQQVNIIRATMSLLTAISSAIVALLVLLYFSGGNECAIGTDPLPAFCTPLQWFLSFLVVLSVVLPAFGGFFGSLADLYQWDRLVSIYDSAVENIEVADARSPDDEMDTLEYRASLRAFAEGTLQVMQDESAQWGQSIRTPRAIEAFIAEERKKAARYGGDADQLTLGPDTADDSPDSADDVSGDPPPPSSAG